MGKEGFRPRFAPDEQQGGQPSGEDASMKRKRGKKREQPQTVPMSAPDISSQAMGESLAPAPKEAELLTNLLEKTDLGVLLEEWANLPFDKRRKVQNLLELFQEATQDIHTYYLTWALDDEWLATFKANRQRKRGTVEQQDAALSETAGELLSAQEQLDAGTERIRDARSLNPEV